MTTDSKHTPFRRAVVTVAILVASVAVTAPVAARPYAGGSSGGGGHSANHATGSTGGHQDADQAGDVADAVADAARETARFHSATQATRAGFGRPPEGPLHECIGMDNDDDPTDDTAAMGFHLINGERVGDAELDPATPEVLVYEPKSNGRLRLVALEYVVFEEAWVAAHPDGTTPRLFGRDMIYTPAPNRYELPAFYQRHLWLWLDNPTGLFESMNPNASCEYANAVE